jgi:AraC-like DNA-binding protein
MQYQIDLFAVFIFVGIVQGVFLLFFFLSRENRRIKTNLFHGIMLVCILACITEIFLMYTGYIIDCLYLVDFSETFGLAIGPAFYLLVLSLTRTKMAGAHYLHFAFPVVYFFLQLPFLVLPEDAKYNAWIGSYHPDWPERAFNYTYDPRLFWLTDHCTEISLVSLLLYGTLGVIEILRVFREKKESFLKPVSSVLKYLRWNLFQILSATIGILMVKLLHENDTGDHLFASYITVTIYVTSFQIIKDSGFFKPASLSPVQKYKSNVIPPEQKQELLIRLRQVMTDDKPFLKSEFSLPELAQKLGTSVHVLSQTINVSLNMSFFEMVAEHRVAEAKKLLRERPHIKVEEIAGEVGYSSKSSFNTAFKKITGSTPSEFRAATKQDT